MLQLLRFPYNDHVKFIFMFITTDETALTFALNFLCYFLLPPSKSLLMDFSSFFVAIFCPRDFLPVIASLDSF
jgi:hypothetical protein